MGPKAGLGMGRLISLFEVSMSERSSRAVGSGMDLTHESVRNNDGNEDGSLPDTIVRPRVASDCSRQQR